MIHVVHTRHLLNHIHIIRFRFIVLNTFDRNNIYLYITQVLNEILKSYQETRNYFCIFYELKM